MGSSPTDPEAGTTCQFTQQTPSPCPSESAVLSCASWQLGGLFKNLPPLSFPPPFFFKYLSSKDYTCHGGAYRNPRESRQFPREAVERRKRAKDTPGYFLCFFFLFIPNSRCSRQKSSRHGRDESRQESSMGTVKGSPTKSLMLIVGLPFSLFEPWETPVCSLSSTAQDFWRLHLELGMNRKKRQRK